MHQTARGLADASYLDGRPTVRAQGQCGPAGVRFEAIAEGGSNGVEDAFTRLTRLRC